MNEPFDTKSPTVMVPMGPGTDWKETVKGIEAALLSVDNDLDGWVVLLKLCGAIHRSNSFDLSVEGYLRFMGILYDRTGDHYEVLEKSIG